MPPRKKAAITKPKAAAKHKTFHVEVGGRSDDNVAQFDSLAAKRGLASRIRWSFVDGKGAKNKATTHLDEQIATIGKHMSDATDRQRALEALGSARIEIADVEITATELRWDIQLDSYYDTWLTIKLYRR